MISDVMMQSGQDSEGNAKPIRADSRFAPSQRETALLCNYVSDWLGTRPQSALHANPMCKVTVTALQMWALSQRQQFVMRAKMHRESPAKVLRLICRSGYFWTFPNNVWPPATVLQSHATSLRRMQKHWESRAWWVQSHCDMGKCLKTVLWCCG